jgi:hypothetical protein
MIRPNARYPLSSDVLHRLKHARELPNRTDRHANSSIESGILYEDIGRVGFERDAIVPVGDGEIAECNVRREERVDAVCVTSWFL